MNPGYFASYTRVIGQTSGYLEERDYQEKILALAGIERETGKSIEEILEGRAKKRLAARQTSGR
jgi:hypothetical protein